MSTTIASPHPTTTFVKLTRVIRASRQDVYDAWAKADILKTWFGPVGCVPTLAESDTRVGGILRFGCKMPGATDTVMVEGVYTEVIPGERLQRTGTHSEKPGDQALLTVTFRDVEGGTEVTVLHEKLPGDSAELYKAGWTGTLNKLEAVFPA